MHWVLVATVAWGALAIGSVYPWGYTPLAIMAAAAGVIGLWDGRPRLAVPVSLAICGGTIALVMGLQLLPLPRAWLAVLSGHWLTALNEIDPVFAMQADGRHAASLAPDQTLLSLLLFTAFALFAVGASSAFAKYGVDRVITVLLALGAFLSLSAIVQQPLYDGRIYGIWELPADRRPFGPFVNRNHFAGWMLMGLPLAFGAFFQQLVRSTKGTKPGLRNRILWLASPHANRLLLIGFCGVLMATSLAFSFSRSGIGAMAVSVILTGWLFARSAEPPLRRVVAVSYLIALFIAVATFLTPDRIADRFQQSNWQTLNERVGPWSDAIQVFERFPLTGTGLGTYAVSMLLYQRHDLERHYREAHNDYLQLVAEGGLLMAAAVLATIVALGFTIRKRLVQDERSTRYWIRSSAVMALAAIAIQETVEFSLQMPGNATMFALLCAIAIHQPPRGTKSRRQRDKDTSRAIDSGASWQQ